MPKGNKLHRVEDVVESIIARIGVIDSYLLGIATLVTFYEVLARYLFNRPSTWAQETTTMIYAAYVMLGAAFNQTRRAGRPHIKMDMFYRRFSVKAKAVIELVGFLCFFLFVAVLLWIGGTLAWNSFLIREHTISPWSPPLYPLRFVIPIGALLMMIMAIIGLIRNIRVLMQKEAAT